MSLDSLQALFIEEVKDIYNGEKQILKALPRMAKAAESAELKQAFTKHLKETEGQVSRLERILQNLGQPVRGKQCKGMAGIIEEGKEKLEEEGEGSVLDAALIAAIAGCASNRNSEAAGARIRDTTLTVRDTTNPSDTLPRIRDSLMDSVP